MLTACLMFRLAVKHVARRNLFRSGRGTSR
jgi:hypothetical protein